MTYRQHTAQDENQCRQIGLLVIVEPSQKELPAAAANKPGGVPSKAVSPGKKPTFAGRTSGRREKNEAPTSTSANLKAFFFFNLRVGHSAKPTIADFLGFAKGLNRLD